MKNKKQDKKLIGNYSHKPREIFWWKSGFTIFYLVFALEALTNSTGDPDLWGYMAFGRLFWETGRFPYKDVFAYLPTFKTWIYHEWLTGVLFYPIYMAWGGLGIQVLKYAFAFATVGLVYLTSRRRGADHWASILALLIITGFFVLSYTPVRAQIFTYFFFALSLYILEKSRLNGNWVGLVSLIPLQILWCNLHGGFLAGLGLIFIYAVGEALSRRSFLPYLGVLVLSGLSTSINPYGLDYWRYLFMAISVPRPEVTEWASIFRAYQTGAFLWEFLYFIIGLAILIYIALRTGWRELTPIIALFVTAYLGLKHLRHQTFFFLLLGAYLPLPLTAYLKKFESDVGLGNLRERFGWKFPAAALSIIILLMAYKVAIHNPLTLVLPPYPEMMTRKSKLYYPVGAMHFIKKNHLSGNLLTEFVWGEYLIWVLSPGCKVSLDGRYETVYPKLVCQEYTNFIYGRCGWRQFLDKYPPDMILVDSRAKITALLRREKTWQQVYQDSGCALFLRSGPEG